MPADLPQRLRELVRLAQPGADPAWLAATAEQLVGALVELDARRRQDDPRRVRTLDLARRVRKAAESMQHLSAIERNKALRERFKVSRSYLYRLLALSPEVVDGCVVDSAS
jgi:hypothetical protein